MDAKRLELLGFIFQDHQLLSYMKIGDQLELVAKLKGGKDKKKRQEEVKALLADLGIEACYHQYPNQMSGGQNNGQPSLGPLSETIRSF